MWWTVINFMKNRAIHHTPRMEIVCLVSFEFAMWVILESLDFHCPKAKNRLIKYLFLNLLTVILLGN